MNLKPAIYGVFMLIGACTNWVEAGRRAHYVLTNHDGPKIDMIEVDEPDYVVEEVEIPEYEGKTFDTRQEVEAAIKLMKDINTLMTTPNPSNFLKVMPQLGPIPVMAGLAKAAKVVGGIIEELFPPDEGPSNEEVIREIHRTFTVLHNKLAVISADIQQLEREIDWMNTQLQYAAVVNIIKTAVELDQKIRTSTSEAEKQRRQDRFVEHCFSQGLLNAVNALFNGITGRGAFTRNIMESYYRKSRGHRSNVIKLGGRMVQLATGGLLALMSYEGIRRGAGGADDMAKDYQPRMQSTQVAVKGAYDKCNTHVGENIAADIREWMTRNPSKGVWDTMWDLHTSVLSFKYDWKSLHTQVVAGSASGEDRIYSKGSSVATCMSCYGKHVRVAYADRYAAGIHPNLPRAWSILNAATGNNAKLVCDQVDSQLRTSGIPWQYLFAIRHGTDASMMGAPDRAAPTMNGGTMRMVMVR